MKPFSFVSLLAASLSLAFNLHATITVIHDWHMGESDTYAANGGYATNTLDSVGGDTLDNQPAGGVYPLYTNNVSSAAAFFANSDLGIFYSGGQYGVASVLPNLTNNFGLELWVYPTNGTSNQVIAYDGNTGTSGWGIYQAGANCAILFGGLFESANIVPLALNTWTEVALVCTNGVATLYTNGVPAFSVTATPYSPLGNFLVGGDDSGLETFSGAVDEVRVFTFATGSFSPTNLLVNGPLVVTSTADFGAGALRAALSAAVAGSTITFATNLSGQTILLTSSGLSANCSVTIDASALPGGIQINGNHAFTVFNIASGVTDVLNSLTITNGYAGSYGGGIDNNGTLTLNDCALSGNSTIGSGDGGGIENFGTMTLNECTLSGNSTVVGGGIENDGTMTLNECTPSGNSATVVGGGIENNRTMTLNECTLSGNSAAIGGGIENEGALTLNDCTLSGNSAGQGGGIYNNNTLTLNECTLSGNSAASQIGGGIFNNGTLTLNECTVSGNTAGEDGGGIFEYTNSTLTLNECTLSGNTAARGGGISEYFGTLRLNNTIVAANSTFYNSAANGPDMYLSAGTITYGGVNLVQYELYNGITVYGSPPLIAAPDLAPLGNYGGPTQTMPPLPGSPAVNAGSVAANTFTNDQRGYPRLIASQIDLGAVEGVYNTNAIVLSNETSLANGSFQFGFTNDEDMTFNVFATTNLALPFGLWQNVGYAAGAPAGSGQFQFTDTNAIHSPQRFYRVVSP